MTDSEMIKQIRTIIGVCDEAVEDQKKYGSVYGQECAKQVAFEHIYKLVKGENNGLS